MSDAAPKGAAEQTPTHIATTIQSFLAEHPHSLLLEDGRTLFDLREAQYSLAAEDDRATLHLWSTERNLVRRVLSVTPRSQTLRLTTQRLGQLRPQTLELTPDHRVRTPTARDTTRQRYLRLLDRAVLRAFPDEKSEGFRSSMDLERSFGPAYARGILTRGQHAWAVIAVNAAESQQTIDGILTIGILWLQHCRDHAAPTTTRTSRLFCGLRLILPCGTAAATLSRLAWLNPRIAQYQLFELDERTEALTQGDPADHGNLSTRLLHAPDESSALHRFSEAIPRVLALLPPNTRVTGLGQENLPAGDPARIDERYPGHAAAISGPGPAHRNHTSSPAAQTCELRLRSSTELAFLLHGFEFARIRLGYAGQTFNRQLQTTFGSGSAETPLLPSTEIHLRELVRHLFDRRCAPSTDAGPANPAQDILFRSNPERWLESTLRADVSALDPNLLKFPVYAQVPALTGGGVSLDRGMLDLLAVTNSNRLAVIELKADEDLHLALQGLDYWIRIRHHHQAHPNPSAGGAYTGVSDLQQNGYFAQMRLSPECPLLLLVAPALHIHPATETVLRHLSPAVPWTLIALDERWRTRIRPIWRKRHSDRG